MVQIEINETLYRIVKIFYQFGILRYKDESDFRKMCRKLYFLTYLVLFIILIIACAFVSDDKSESIFLMAIAIGATVVTVKAMFLLWKKEELLEFLNLSVIVNSTQDAEESENVIKKLEKFMKFTRVYLVIMSCGCIFSIVSCLPMFYNEKRLLPLFINFALDCDYSEIIYCLTYVFIASALIFFVVFNLITILIWYIMLKYSNEYEVLGSNLRKLGTKTLEVQNKSQRAKQQLFLLDLIGLIKDHQKLCNTIERFRSFFSKLFLMQITTSGLSICISTFNLAFRCHENVIQTAVFIVVLLFGTFDIFLVMYLANEITVASDRLSYCLFESNWIEQTESCKRCVIIMGEVLKKPHQLVIFIYPMNLETFTSIMDGAYRMFNILKNFK